MVEHELVALVTRVQFPLDTQIKITLRYGVILILSRGLRIIRKPCLNELIFKNITRAISKLFLDY